MSHESIIENANARSIDEEPLSSLDPASFPYLATIEEEKHPDPDFVPEENMIDMSAVFLPEDMPLPPYSPELSKAAIAKALMELPLPKAFGAMLEQGYPEHVVGLLERTFAHHGVAGLKSIVDRASAISKQRKQREDARQIVRRSGRKEGRYMLAGKGSGRSVTDWRVPFGSSDREIPRPSYYSRASFRMWAHGEARRLSKLITKKTQYVTGNLAAQACYYGSSASAAVFAQASIYIDDYRAEPPRPKPFLLGEAVVLSDPTRAVLESRRTVTVFGVTYTEPTELLRFILGAKNALYFRQIEAYLLGRPLNGVAVDWLRLQAALMAKFPPVVLEHTFCEVARVANGDFPSWKSLGEKVAHFEGGVGYLQAAIVGRTAVQLANQLGSRGVDLRTDRGLRFLKKFRANPLVLDRIAENPFDVVQVLFTKKGIRRVPPTEFTPVRIPHEDQPWFVGPSPPRDAWTLVRRGRKDPTEKVSFQGSTISSSINASADTLLANWIVSHERDLASVGVLFAGLYAATSWTSRAAAIAAFITSNEFLYSRLRFQFSSIAFQGDEEDDFQGPRKPGWLSGMVMQVWEAVVTSSVYLTLSALGRDTFEMFAGPIRDFIRGELKTTFIKQTALSIAQGFLECIKECLRRVQMCWKMRSLNPLWGPSWDPDLWITQATGIVAHRSLLASSGDPNISDAGEVEKLRLKGAIPSNWYFPASRAEYVARLSDHRDDGIRLAKYFAKTKTGAALAGAVNSLSQSLLQEEVNDYAGRKRIAPFGLMVYGKPGQGKTNLMDMIKRSIAQKRKWDATSAGEYNWVPNANFQSGLNRQWHVILNDVDHGIAPVQAGVDTHIQTFTKLKDNAPYPVEEAVAQDKGHTYATPMLLSYVTNFFGGLARTNTAVPDAFWRRVNLHVEICLKPEFMTAEGVGDPAKMSDSTSHDMFVIDVRRYRATNGAQIPLSDPVRYSLPEFMILLHSEMDAHLKHETDAKSRRAYDGDFCEKCFLPRTKTCCGPELPDEKIELQGAQQSVPSSPSLEEEEEVTEIAATLPSHLSIRERLSEMCVRHTLRTRLESFAETIRSDKRKALKVTLGVLAGGAAALGIAILALERYALQAREANTTGQTPPSWTRASTDYQKGLPPNPSHATYTKAQLEENIVRCFVKFHGASGVTLNAVCITHNAVLVPTHAVALGPSHIVIGDMSYQFVVTEGSHCILPCAQQLCVVIVAGLMGRATLGAYLYHELPGDVSQFDEVELWHTSKLKSSVANWKTVYPEGPALMVPFADPTVNGDCGMLYVARFGQAWRVVAMHFAENTSMLHAPRAMGAMFSRMDIEAALKVVGTTYQGVAMISSMFVPEGGVQFSDLPMVSELDSARTQGAYVFPVGTMSPRLRGATMKTKVQRSLIADDCERLSTAWCRQPNYWRLPDFRGRMVDGKWTSPYTNMFATPNRVPLDRDLMWVALADYLNDAMRLDRDGYRPLSEDEVLTGIPCSVIGGVDVKTSVGPPFGRAKSNFMLLSRGESYMDERIWGIVDELEDLLEKGDIVSPCGICTPKDEALKPGKLPRIFINLPFPYNFVEKKVFAPIVAFIRHNPFFFRVHGWS